MAADNDAPGLLVPGAFRYFSQKVAAWKRGGKFPGGLRHYVPQHLLQRPAPMRRVTGHAKRFDAVVLADDVARMKEAVFKSA